MMKMNEHLSPESASWIAALVYKLLPASLGALVMVIFDVPKDRKELFYRLLVAGIFSLMLGDVVFDWLDSMTWFSFLDPFNRKHHVAVDFIVGGLGWSIMAAAALYTKKFSKDPVGTIKEIKS